MHDHHHTEHMADNEHGLRLDAVATAETDERDRGQATTEYALVLLGAALVALMLVAWAGSGGAAGKIGQLFDHVIDSITSRL